jgi:hypothetical protein
MAGPVFLLRDAAGAIYALPEAELKKSQVRPEYVGHIEGAFKGQRRILKATDKGPKPPKRLSDLIFAEKDGGDKGPKPPKLDALQFVGELEGL